MRTRSWDAIASITGRYWLLENGEWREATQAEYIAAERAAGFNAPAGKVATAAFENSRLGLRGTTLDPTGGTR